MQARSTCSGRFRIFAALAAAVTSVVVLAGAAGAEPSLGTVASMPSVVGATHVNLAPFTSVSCPTAASCTAAGPALPALANAGGRAAVTDRVAGHWATPTALQLPAGAVGSADFSPAALDVSCWDATDCAAVGEFSVSEEFEGLPVTVYEPMVDLETAGVWGQAQQITTPITTDVAGALTSVSCNPGGTCTAAGLFQVIDVFDGTSTFHTMTVTESSGTWSTAAMGTDPPVIGAIIAPSGISCAAATDCAYVEQVQTAAGAWRTYVVTEASGVWSAPSLLAGPGGHPWEGSSISCATATSCVVVGAGATTNAGLTNSVGEFPVVTAEHAGAWGASTALALPLLSPVTVAGGLTSVSCVTATLCEAVGTGFTDVKSEFGVPMAATLFGAKWSSIALYPGVVRAGPSRATASVFTGVSCGSPVACVAVGEAGAGPFTAKKANVFSFSDVVGPVRKVTLPDPPIGLRASGTSTSATMAWLPPDGDGGSPIQAFTLTATSPTERLRSCTTHATTCEMRGLAKGHRYRLSVHAKTAYGTSRPTTIFFDVP